MLHPVTFALASETRLAFLAPEIISAVAAISAPWILCNDRGVLLLIIPPSAADLNEPGKVSGESRRECAQHGLFRHCDMGQWIERSKPDDVCIDERYLVVNLFAAIDDHAYPFERIENWSAA